MRTFPRQGDFYLLEVLNRIELLVSRYKGDGLPLTERTLVELAPLFASPLVCIEGLPQTLGSEVSDD